MQRCEWVTSDPLYIAYHDTEWGIPQTHRQHLYEMICLEGQQAGLSWITVLKKRENYRAAFAQFVPEKVAQFDEKDIERLLQNSGIIRHRGKLEAIILNAKALLAMEAAGEDFVTFIWDFVDATPQVSHYADYRQAPTTNATSEALSKALKKRGFRFVGPTTCYSFMQACGLINDHTTACFCHPDNQK
ncbi:DNA-3-methyladenine glycosylase I [Enterobacterales bacterium CwR94]|nr:DNA-3-methyladenine glycosylase I [Enterobacterales bacterium CwR94]